MGSVGFRDKLVKPIGKDERLLCLLLVLSAVRKYPCHPVQCTSGVPYISSQAVDELVEWNSDREGIRGPKSEAPEQLRRGLKMFLDCLRVKIMQGLDCWKRWQFIFATSCEGGCNFANDLSYIGVVANGRHGTNSEDLFDWYISLVCRCQVEKDVGVCTVDVKSRGIKESCPQTMNQPRAQKLKRPIARIICMTELHVLKENLHDV
jgi:hypothetical protein